MLQLKSAQISYNTLGKSNSDVSDESKENYQVQDELSQCDWDNDLTAIPECFIYSGAKTS